MPNITKWLRKYIGSIVSVMGCILLIILTYGDLGELLTEQYWENVGGNITSISALSIGLIMVQVAIKQGIGEQALSAGLNTDNTTAKFKEHKCIVGRNREKYVFLPYFLSMRNERETNIKKREFLISNDFTSESALLNFQIPKNCSFFTKLSLRMMKKRIMRQYKAININLTVDSIKWSTTNISYKKNGQIEKLNEFRKKRAISGLLYGILFMVGAVFITGGMFLDPAEIPFWQKTIKFITYLFVIALTAIFDINKNYEKGAFVVPNELDEINNIWLEFETWEVPTWIKEEVERNSKSKSHIVMLDCDECRKIEGGVDKNETRETVDTR